MAPWGIFTNVSHITSSVPEATDLPKVHTILEVFPVILNPLDGGWFGKVGTSAVLVFGTFGNLMTIAILRLYHSGWSAMNVYLTALAISDTAMLYSTALPMCVRKVLDFDVYIIHPVVCKVLIWMTNGSAMASAYILVALTIQRALSVVWPHRVNVLCTRGKSVTVIVTVTVVCALTWCHVLYGYDIVHVSNGTSARCTFGSQSYQHFWVNHWVKTDLFIFGVIPLVVLLISNTTLGWKLAVSVKEAQQRFSPSAREDQKTDRKKKASSTTLTLIVVSTAYMITTLPYMIYNTMYQHLASQDDRSRRLHYFIFDLFLVFGLANFAWNFYLYCMTGTKFRREFLSLLSKCCGCMTISTPAPSQDKEVKTAAAGNLRLKKHTELENNDDF